MADKEQTVSLEKLNAAVQTLKQFCKEKPTCAICPMHDNCEMTFILNWGSVEIEKIQDDDFLGLVVKEKE